MRLPGEREGAQGTRGSDGAIGEGGLAHFTALAANLQDSLTTATGVVLEVSVEDGMRIDDNVEPMKTAASVLVLIVAGSLAHGEGKQEPTKLQATLVIDDVQGGITGFHGVRTTVQPSGLWIKVDLGDGEETFRNRGELSAAQVATLVSELAIYRPETLPNVKRDRRAANPRIITITYGEHKAKLVTNGRLGKPDADSVKGRFAGIVTAVKKHLRD